MAETEFGTTPNVRSSSKIALLWHGLPGYARSCIAHTVERHPEIEWTIIGTVSHDHQQYAEAKDCGGVLVRYLDRLGSKGWDELEIDPPDLVILTSWAHPQFMKLGAEAREKGGRVVLMMDNVFLPTLRKLLGIGYFRARLHRCYDGVWVPGRAARKFARVLGFAPHEIEDGLYCGNEAVFRAVSPPPQGGKLLYVGQLIARKGIPALVELAEAGSLDPQRVIMVGVGPLEEKARKAGFQILGFRSAGEIAKLVEESVALLAPSRLDHWGVVLHEAALAGRMILSTRHTYAAADLVQHGINGYVMANSTPGEVLKALKWLDSLTEEGLRYANAVSRERARQFSWNRWENTLLSFARA